jgi:hypothetical protein
VWRWKPWKRWAFALASLTVGYVLSFDGVRLLLISAGRSDWWWTLHQSVYAPVHALRSAIGVWP